MITITWHEGNGFEDGIGIGFDDPGAYEGREVDDMLDMATERIVARVKKGSRVVYAGTRRGNMEPGALVMIPGALFAKRAKSTAIKAATEAIREWSPSVEIQTRDMPRKARMP